MDPNRVNLLLCFVDFDTKKRLEGCGLLRWWEEVRACWMESLDWQIRGARGDTVGAWSLWSSCWGCWSAREKKSFKGGLFIVMWSKMSCEVGELSIDLKFRWGWRELVNSWWISWLNLDAVVGRRIMELLRFVVLVEDDQRIGSRFLKSWWCDRGGRFWRGIGGGSLIGKEGGVNRWWRWQDGVWWFLIFFAFFPLLFSDLSFLFFYEIFSKETKIKTYEEDRRCKIWIWALIPNMM